MIVSHDPRAVIVPYLLACPFKSTIDNVQSTIIVDSLLSFLHLVLKKNIVDGGSKTKRTSSHKNV